MAIFQISIDQYNRIEVMKICVYFSEQFFHSYIWEVFYLIQYKFYKTYIVIYYIQLQNLQMGGISFTLISV